MLLEARHITKKFRRGGGGEFFAVENADLALEAGEFAALTGRSGSGKTTLVNVLCGLLTPDDGEVFFDGRDLRGLSDAELSLWRNRNIGYVPQGQSLVSTLTVLENTRLPAHIHGGPDAKQSGPRALALLERFGIAHLAQNRPSSLSGGETRRVAIARALINSPRLVIADEPTSDLDVATTREIAAIFAALVKDGSAVLAVTHDPELGEFATRSFTMENGRLR